MDSFRGLSSADWLANYRAPVLADGRKRMLLVKSTSAIRKLDSSSDEGPEMVTAKGLETMLKIDVKTIYSYVQRGLIPYVRIQSNLRFPRQAILHWIEKQSYCPGAVHRGDPS